MVHCPLKTNKFKKYMYQKLTGVAFQLDNSVIEVEVVAAAAAAFHRREYCMVIILRIFNGTH